MRDLNEAANILDISEFEVLRRAYANWFQREASSSELEQIFSHYLNHNKLPVWACHYVRQVIREFEKQYGVGCHCMKLFLLILTGGRRFGIYRSSPDRVNF